MEQSQSQSQNQNQNQNVKGTSNSNPYKDLFSTSPEAKSNDDKKQKQYVSRQQVIPSQTHADSSPNDGEASGQDEQFEHFVEKSKQDIQEGALLHATNQQSGQSKQE